MSSSPGPLDISTRRLAWVLVALVVATFGTTLFGSFVFDDRFIIVLNSYLPNPSDWTRFFTEGSWAGSGGDASNYRSLPLLSFGVNYLIGGLRPFDYHLANLVFHIINVLILFTLAQRLGLSKNSAWLASALFAVHPLQTEPVAGIVGRMDLMAATGLLAALLCHLNGRASDERRSRRLWFTGAALSYAFALWSKEHAILFPAIAIAGDLLLTSRATARRYWPHLAYAMVGGLYLVIWFSIFSADSLAAGAAPTLNNPLAPVPGPLRFVSALWVAGLYLVHLIWPVNLSPDYCYGQILPLESLASGKAAVALLGAGVFIVVGTIIGRKIRVAAVAIILAFVTFLPVSNLLFPIGTVMGDRLFYLPVAGFSLVMATVADRMAARSGKNRFSFGLLIVIAFLAALSFRQSLVWNSNYTLDRQAVKAAPQCARGHASLGYDLMERQEIDAAEQSFLKAIDLYSPNPRAQAGLGRVAFARNDFPGALRVAEEVLAENPEYSEMMHLAASAAVQIGDNERAEQHWRRAKDADPTDVQAMSNLAILAWSRGESREAIDLWSQAVSHPEVPATVIFNLARAYDELDETSEALRYYELFLHRAKLAPVDPAGVALAEERAVALGKTTASD